MTAGDTRPEGSDPEAPQTPEPVPLLTPRDGVPDVIVRKQRNQWTASLNEAAMPKLRLSPLMQKLTAYGFIYVAWSFTLFYWVGNAAGNRGLTMGDNPLGKADLTGVIAFLPGLPSVFIVVVLLFIAAKSALSSRGD